MFSDIVKNGMKKIKEKDFEAQKEFIDIICEEVRNMNSDIIYKFDGIFIPNDNYMIEYFGKHITNFEYDCYDEFDYCIWNNFLIFPLYNILENVVGFVGFNPFNKEININNEDEDVEYLQVYRDSSKMLVDKRKFLFMIKGMYKKAIKDGYIVITDGVFDTISFTQNGVNAGALLGSSLSDEIISFLKLIPKVYVACDNDDAGVYLYNSLKKKLPRLRKFTQTIYKDSDDVLKSKYKDLYLNEFFRNLKSDIDFDVIVNIEDITIKSSGKLPDKKLKNEIDFILNELDIL